MREIAKKYPNPNLGTHLYKFTEMRSNSNPNLGRYCHYYSLPSSIYPNEMNTRGTLQTRQNNHFQPPLNLVGEIPNRLIFRIFWNWILTCVSAVTHKYRKRGVHKESPQCLTSPDVFTTSSLWNKWSEVSWSPLCFSPIDSETTDLWKQRRTDRLKLVWRLFNQPTDVFLVLLKSGDSVVTRFERLDNDWETRAFALTQSKTDIYFGSLEWTVPKLNGRNQEPVRVAQPTKTISISQCFYPTH